MYYCEETKRHQQGDTFDDIAEWIRKSQDKEEKKRKSFFKFRGDRQMREITNNVWSTNPREMQSIDRRKSLVNYSDKRSNRVKREEAKRIALINFIKEEGR